MQIADDRSFGEIWRPGWHLELLVTPLGSFQNSVCCAAVHIVMLGGSHCHQGEVLPWQGSGGRCISSDIHMHARTEWFPRTHCTATAWLQLCTPSTSVADWLTLKHSCCCWFLNDSTILGTSSQKDSNSVKPLLATKLYTFRTIYFHFQIWTEEICTAPLPWIFSLFYWSFLNSGQLTSSQPLSSRASITATTQVPTQRL